MGLFGKKKEKKQVTVNQQQQKNVAPVKVSHKRKYSEKIRPFDVYDDIVSNLQLKDMIIDDGEILSNERVKLGFGKITTKNYIIKTFVVNDIESYINTDVIGRIKNKALENVYHTKINTFMSTIPKVIDWEKPEMKSRMQQFERYSRTNNLEEGGIATARKNASAIKRLSDTMTTFEYLQKIDLDYQRTITATSIFFEIIGNRNNIEELERTIRQFRSACAGEGFRVVENKADIFEWVRRILPTSMRTNGDIDRKTVRKVLSDDNLGEMTEITQGMIGEKGVPLGIDVYSGLPVFHVVREDKDSAENIIVSAGTGGGKSVFVKNFITWAIQEMTVTVLDYEGDEYTNLATVINDGNPGDAVVIDVSAGNGKYFDPLKIADPIGDPEIDKEALSQSRKTTIAMYSLLLSSGGENKVGEEEKIILSDCIKRVYDTAGITENPKTWWKSSELRIGDVYEHLKQGVAGKRWNRVNDDSLHKMARRMQLILKKFFEEGESEYGIFREAIDIKDIRNARFIVFSFGQHGASNIGADSTELQLKQLCVSNVSSQISNYCLNVKNCFNIKVWEEFQRWGAIKGSAEIIGNGFTGGRKRGDVNILITNDLDAMLDENNELNKKLKGNTQGFCIGLQKSTDTIKNFCEKFKLKEFEYDISLISTDGMEDSGGMYRNAFCCIFEKTSKSPAIKCICKPAVSPVILESGVYGKLMKNKED